MMSLTTKKYIVGALGLLFLLSLLLVQKLELDRQRQERSGAVEPKLSSASKECHDCHAEQTPGIIEHWRTSKHAALGVGCFECHMAEAGELDAFAHHGQTIATIVTPKDCSRCHAEIFEEFQGSHHARAGNIMASLDNLLAESVEGFRAGPTRVPDPHDPGHFIELNGLASANSGCHQCHGSTVALLAHDGTPVTIDNAAEYTADRILVEDGRPVLDSRTWPNTGIGRINLDGSLGSCSACHSRHDFSARRARRPENCGKCHLGPDHPQKEIYEESKHGVAFYDLVAAMNLDSEGTWIVGKDYSAAPTCATCHMSATRHQPITHDPGNRISWTNRPPVSLRLDTDVGHQVIKDVDPAVRAQKLANGGMTWQAKRNNMKDVCTNCHSPSYVDAFYRQYDDLVNLYNQKFGVPGTKIMESLVAGGLITKTDFDDEIEWTWFYLWHHEGRRARHGASMMAPDYTHWHGMFEVADRWYLEFIPQAREIVARAEQDPRRREAALASSAIIDEIMASEWHAQARPVTEHGDTRSTLAPPTGEHAPAD